MAREHRVSDGSRRCVPRPRPAPGVRASARGGQRWMQSLAAAHRVHRSLPPLPGMLSESPDADPHAGWCGRARATLASTRFGARRRGDHRPKSRHRRLAADPARPAISQLGDRRRRRVCPGAGRVADVDDGGLRGHPPGWRVVACAKKRQIASVALGPRGSVWEPSGAPPDHACPSPSTLRSSCIRAPRRSVHRQRAYA